MTDPETIRVYDSQAADYAAKTDQYNQTDPRLRAFVAACRPGGRVLDLGCGPGASAAEMARNGLTVEATDASAEMVMLAGQHPGVKARQATFDDIAGTDLYDGIWANFSLLHAPRDAFPRHLDALAQALKPGGVFHIGMKLGEAEARDRIGRRYTYYTADELRSRLSAAGMTVVEEHFGRGEGLDGTMSDWVSLLART